MAGYFAKYNVRMGDALRHFSVIKANFQNQVDASTGKPMSSSKAEILSEATDEAAIYQMARIHVNNIQEMINGLKSLQKGVLFEYANAV
jgi:proline racemase